MCVGGGTPDVPTVPERQSAKQPESAGGTAGRAADIAKRRMQYAASILTSPQGVLGAAGTTANMPATTGA